MTNDELTIIATVLSSAAGLLKSHESELRGFDLDARLRPNEVGSRMFGLAARDGLQFLETYERQTAAIRDALKKVNAK